MILGAGCFARRQEWAQGNEAKEKWFTKLDVLRVKYKGKESFSDSEIRDLGIDAVRLTNDGVSAVSLQLMNQ